MTIRMGETYVANGQLTQAGYSALRGTETAVGALQAADVALDARIDVLEGYRAVKLLATKTASASATLDFTEFNNAVYSQYLFEFDEVKPATDVVGLAARVSTNGGSSYDSGATDYMGSAWGHAQPGSAATAGTAGLGYITRASVGNAAAEYGVTGHMWLRFAGDGNKQTRALCQTSYEQDNSWVETGHASWFRRSAQDTDAIRFLFSSGNIASGTIRMYGLT
jgi:hypothetical protein